MGTGKEIVPRELSLKITVVTSNGQVDEHIISLPFSTEQSQAIMSNIFNMIQEVMAGKLTALVLPNPASWYKSSYVVKVTIESSSELENDLQGQTLGFLRDRSK